MHSVRFIRTAYNDDIFSEAVKIVGGPISREVMLHKNLFQLTFGVLLFFIAVPGVFGQQLSVGFVGGTNLTHDFHTFGTNYLDPAFPGGLTTFLLYSDSHSFIGGPTIEVPLPKRFALEVDALHRSLQLKRAFILPGGQRVNDGGDAIGTWEF